MEESIYNIIKDEVPPPERGPRYQSKFPGSIAPTGSTFNVQHTSRPGVSNLAGNSVCVDFNYKYSKPKSTFGPAPCDALPDTSAFLKGKQYAKPVATLRTIKKDHPEKLKPTTLKEKMKPGIPSKADKPIMNLVTSKNFIVANAVENILMAPKKSPNNEEDFLNKEDYGKVPAYIGQIRKDIEAEYQYIRDLQNEEREKQVVPRPLEQEEKEALIQALKAKWEEVNSEYQLGAHLTKLDTVGKMRRKEQQEKMLTQLEKDIERIKKENVLIDPSM
mmetsp:Transcript_22842/g.57752  ORF Transcript_22842/g.57752 Transcript_22842/m.57752 type:complete len:275 (-) Transcript_22842:463-1287(-)